MKRQPLQRFGIAVLVACLTGCAAWSYLAYRISPDHPEDVTETLQLAGLRGPVRVHLDTLGVPHVEAESEIDLVRAVGFLHGRARFFQMDVIRRYSCGRLSELVGEQEALFGTTVELDATMRGWGFDRSTRAEAAGLEGEMRQLTDAYVEGVNAGLERFEPVEYRLLRVRPEPWTVADSFAVGHMIAWGITHNWQQEVCRLLLALEGGHERAERILPPEPWAGDPSLPGAVEPRALPPSVAPELEGLFPGRPWSAPKAEAQIRSAEPTLALPRYKGASNGWVLGGGRTRSGMPLLAGDPHLPHMVPSIVFQQHLRCPGLDVIGATVPGIPYVIFGHNEKVAWTITAAMADVLDLYIEREAPSGEAVLGPEGPEPLVADSIVVRVRDGEDRTTTIRRTPRGPLLNDMYPGLLPEGAPLVSIHGILERVAGTLDGLRRANRARDVHELRLAMRDVMAPIASVAAADGNGEIALFASGTVPVREHHRGTFPAPGWLPEYRWGREATADEVPHGTGAGRDFFVNTNNLMIDPACAPVLFHIDSATSYRRDRIVELIEATGRHDVASNARIQGDTLLNRARRLVPVFLEDLDGAEPAARKLLAEWDFRAGADSAACAIFFAIFREAILGAIHDEVGEEGLAFLVSFRYFTNGVDQWFDDPDHPVWDDRSTAERETRAGILRAAFGRALRWLSEEFDSEDPGDWRWGQLHLQHSQHALGSKVGAFNLPAWQAPGATASVWKADFDMSRPDGPFRSLYGPVLRMIVDLADIEHASWVIDSGSSGWPLAPHYGDQHELWRNVRLAPMVSNWAEIRRDAVAVLTLAEVVSE